MNNSQLINQDSGDYEYYTPLEIVNAAREVMGSIDLDPFSSEQANKRVMASVYFDTKINGLDERWFGNVWMNHPFSGGEKPCKPKCKKKRCDPIFGTEDWREKPPHWRGNCIDYYVPKNEDYINKYISQFEDGDVLQACNITYNSTSENWFYPLLHYPQCILAPGRTNYYLPDGSLKKGVTKGSVVTYLGINVDKFIEVFDGKFGKVKI